MVVTVALDERVNGLRNGGREREAKSEATRHLMGDRRLFTSSPAWKDILALGRHTFIRSGSAASVTRRQDDI